MDGKKGNAETSGPKGSSVLGSVWFIETEPENENDEHSSIRGGGLCIDNKRGLIITVAHVVIIKGLGPDECHIRARSGKDSNLDSREVRLIGVLPQFDLALIQVSIEDNEDLDFVSLDNNVQVDIHEEVFGYVHQSDLLFTKNSGYTSYPLPKSIDIPAMTDTSTIESSGCLRRNRNYLADPPYRTVLSITGREDVNFHDLNPKLPLVQVDGFGIGAGTSGCPLFKKKGKELIGLFCAQKFLSQYIIPVNIMRKFVDYILAGKKIDRLKRDRRQNV